MRRPRARILVLLLAGLLHAPAAHAEVRALLVGVSHYVSPAIPDLEGPTNDLAAMEVLARKEGAKDVTVLRDQAVTRSSVENALHEIGQRSKAGDWILFYYSGHGSQAEARVKGTRDGDFDQFLPLPGFDPKNQDPEHFIVDKDFYDWLSRYVARDVQILMLADTCHSGTMHRSIDQRSYRFTPRLALRAMASKVQLVPRPAPRFPSVLKYRSNAKPLTGGTVDREDLPNLIFLAAAQDDELAQELAMPDEDGPSRGLLTYAFEQGLLQVGPDKKTLLADLDGDGVVSIAEIAVYVEGQVRSITAERQQPRAAYVTGKEAVKLFARSDVASKAPTKVSLPSVFIQSGHRGIQPEPQEAFWQVVQSSDKADFVWDLKTGDVVRRSGDIVAQGVDTVPKLTGVLEKWQAFEALQPLLNEARAKLAVEPLRPGSRYPSGSQVKVSLAAGNLVPDAAFATVFNVAADGTIQLIFPTTASDGKGQLAAGKVLPLIKAEVVAPYGVDHVVAVVSRKDQSEFRAFLQSINGQRGFGKLVEPIHKLIALDPQGSSISLAQIYTARTAE